MKKRLFLILIVMVSTFCHSANAQLSVGVNIGLQPIWGPVGYDYVNYYYIPDIDAYYDVPNQVYVYNNGSRWIRSRSLPPRYRDFDLYHSHKVVINERTPWMHHDKYRQQYGGYKGMHDQQVIRDSHEEKYFQNPHHPEHNRWHGEGRGHENHGYEGRGHEGHGHENHGHEDHGHGDHGHH